jgi:hypothetical protein
LLQCACNTSWELGTLRSKSNVDTREILCFLSFPVPKKKKIKNPYAVTSEKRKKNSER